MILRCPVCGPDLSRDPVAGDPRQPESFHPYLFANANPMVFSDPSGLFTMVEVNINLSADNILQSFKIEAQNVIREEIKSRIYEVATNLLVNFIESSFGLQTAGIEVRY